MLAVSVTSIDLVSALPLLTPPFAARYCNCSHHTCIIEGQRLLPSCVPPSTLLRARPTKAPCGDHTANTPFAPEVEPCGVLISSLNKMTFCLTKRIICECDHLQGEVCDAPPSVCCLQLLIVYMLVAVVCLAVGPSRVHSRLRAAQTCGSRR